MPNFGQYSVGLKFNLGVNDKTYSEPKFIFPHYMNAVKIEHDRAKFAQSIKVPIT